MATNQGQRMTILSRVVCSDIVIKGQNGNAKDWFIATWNNKLSHSHTTKIKLSAACFWPKLERACSQVADHDRSHAHLMPFSYGFE